VARLEKAQRKDEALAALRKLLEVETGDPLSLLRLADLLAKQKAWPLVEEMETRFPGPVSRISLLLYCVANARAQQGKLQEAEATAARARGLDPGKADQVLYRHAEVARELVERGMFAWAEQECRYVIAAADRQHLLGLFARHTLASMFHDLDENLKAAEVEKEMVEILKQAKPGKTDLPLESLAATTGQMHYYYACHWLAQGDREKHRKHLDDSLAADPKNVDALIAAYRLADAPPEHRRKTVEGVKSCVAEMRKEIAKQPAQAVQYNNLAWLVANTEGDLDEALKCSRKSLELEPNNGGYYDTLARVYYARGDHASAVEYQAKAAELNPHSRQIARQLKLFQEALAAAKKPS
jgi:tetratricopeptide (TPR) repeat protein